MNECESHCPSEVGEIGEGLEHSIPNGILSFVSELWQQACDMEYEADKSSAVQSADDISLDLLVLRDSSLGDLDPPGHSGGDAVRLR